MHVVVAVQDNNLNAAPVHDLFWINSLVGAAKMIAIVAYSVLHCNWSLVSHRLMFSLNVVPL